jgi:ring-1,2-phenylacetyl-CoA epoxidase subunit PaaD
VTASLGPTRHDVRTALATIPDPEIPVLSVIDMGIVHDVVVGPDAIRVTILPTFVGCPALDMIKSSIADDLGARFGRSVRVETTFAVPWSSDRISSAGRRALAAAGIAPPSPGDPACPWCDGHRVVMDSAFGPTQCRSLYYCRDCRQPFEAMKSV